MIITLSTQRYFCVFCGNKRYENKATQFKIDRRR